MPFTTQAQRKACWAQWNRDIRNGVEPRWNCREWEEDTPAWIPGMRTNRTKSKAKKSTSYTKVRIPLTRDHLSVRLDDGSKEHYHIRYATKARHAILDDVIEQRSGKSPALSVYRALIARRTLGKRVLTTKQRATLTSDAKYVKTKFYDTEFWPMANKARAKASRAYERYDSSCSSSTSESDEH